jgi:hypothetical protein
MIPISGFAEVPVINPGDSLQRNAPQMILSTPVGSACRRIAFLIDAPFLSRRISSLTCLESVNHRHRNQERQRHRLQFANVYSVKVENLHVQRRINTPGAFHFAQRLVASPSNQIIIDFIVR